MATKLKTDNFMPKKIISVSNIGICKSECVRHLQFLLSETKQNC